LINMSELPRAAAHAAAVTANTLGVLVQAVVEHSVPINLSSSPFTPVMVDAAG
jgi:hypothetical protein